MRAGSGSGVVGAVRGEKFILIDGNEMSAYGACYRTIFGKG